MSELRSQLQSLLARGGRELEAFSPERIAIYGAGGCGRRIADEAREHGIEVVAFIDARASAEETLDGTALLSPDAAEAKNLARSGVPVVIGIFNFATDVEPVRCRLIELGFSRILSYPEFHERYGSAADFWLTKRAFYQPRTDEILAGFDVFNDERSRELYVDCVRYRLDVDPLLLRQPDTANHYLPQDLPAAESPMRLIDGGAFTGDSLERFITGGVDIRAVAAFEPDLANYRHLVATVARLHEQIGESILVPCGLGERTEMLSFSSGGSSSSSLTTAGTTHVQVVALDDMLPDFAPTFIKLDIEGAEPAALRGAAELIARSRPRLAVCVYHAPEHLWTIPLLIRQLQPSYRVALRYHQWNGFDMVAYAFPR